MLIRGLNQLFRAILDRTDNYRILGDFLSRCQRWLMVRIGAILVRLRPHIRLRRFHLAYLLRGHMNCLSQRAVQLRILHRIEERVLLRAALFFDLKHVA